MRRVALKENGYLASRSVLDDVIEIGVRFAAYVWQRVRRRFAALVVNQNTKVVKGS